MNNSGMNDPGPPTHNPNGDDGTTDRGGTTDRILTDGEGLLEHLARLAREERRNEAQQLDPRWDALAAGTLDAEGVAALRALADQSPEHARAWEAFQPLDEAFQDRVLAKLGGAQAKLGGAQAKLGGAQAKLGGAQAKLGGAQAKLGGAEAQRANPAPEGQVIPWPGAETPSTEATSTPSAATASPVASPRRGWRRAVWVPLAAAAALGVLWLRPPSVQPLPEYTVSMQGIESLRSSGGEAPASQEVPRYAPGSRFELVLAPATAVEGPLAVDLWEATGAGPELLELDTEIADTGAVRLVGTVGEALDLPVGPSTLWLVVRRGASEPRPEAATVAAWSRGGEVPTGTLFERLDLLVVSDPTPPEAQAEPPPEDPG